MDLTNIFRRVANSKSQFVSAFDKDFDISRDVDFYDQAIELMIIAKKFTFQPTVLDHIEGGAEFSRACLAEGIFTLPFNECLFVGQSDAILAWNENGVQFRHISLATAEEDDIFAPTPIKYSLAKPTIANQFSNYTAEFSNNWVKGIMGGNEEAWKIHDQKRTDMLLGFVGLLRTDGLSAKAYIPDPKLQTSRIKSGKQPLYEHTEIFIARATDTLHESSRTSVYTPKRLHWRRGHVRRIKKGNLVAVRPCLVGDKSRGFITHDYNVGK